MSNSVILIVANDDYLPHAKSLMAGCIRQGSWKGDFCLLCPDACNTSSIEGRGIDVFRAPELKWTNKIKFRIFSSYFRKWKRLLYLDCDILIQGNLNDLCTDLLTKFPSILCDGSHNGTILNDWIHFDPNSSKENNAHPEIYKKLRERFPHIDERILTSDVMYFSPSSISDTVVDNLFAIQEEFVTINPGNYDQQVMNLLLYGQMLPITKDYCTWWAFDDPGNRIPHDVNGWTGNEKPVISHYWGMYAPWIVKTPDAGAYFNHRLGRVCHELYAENLAAFDNVFPLF